MQPQFLELLTRTYIGKEFRQYINDTEPDNLPEGDEWKATLKEDIEAPKGHLTRMYINPGDIRSYSETFSLEEMHNNPENPALDSVEVTFHWGESLCFAISIEQFHKKLKAYYKKQVKEEKPTE